MTLWRGVRERIRARFQLPETWSVSDLWASIRTGPVSIEEFRTADSSPVQGSSPLMELALGLQGPPFVKWWHYFNIYDRELRGIATAFNSATPSLVPRVLEIGVWRGGSLALWRNYFGQGAVIFGIDIDPASADAGSTHAQVRIGSQTDPSFLNQVVTEMGGLDVVIDDGSHVCSDVLETLQVLWPMLSDSGVYIVEDLHTSYWPAWGGGLRRRRGAIEQFKDLVDELHRPYYRRARQKDSSVVSRDSLASVTFYDSIVVLRKGVCPDPRPFRGGYWG